MAANPRAANKHGHVVEMVPPGSGADVDHAALKFRWNILLLAGNPRKPEDGAKYHGEVTENGLAVVPRQLRVRQPGTSVDRHRRRAQRGGLRRRRVGHRHGRQRPCA